MPLRPNMEPSDFLDIFKRRKWLIVFSFLLIFFGALVYCVVTPDQYQSNAKILIIPPAVAEGMVRSTVHLSTEDRLRTIQMDVFGRVRLLDVIKEIGVSKLGFDGKSEGEMLNEMRNRIDLGVDRKKTSDPGNVNTFVLSFLHEKPAVAQEVAARLSSLFIGENIRLRESVTTETTRFLDQQLEETRKRLEVQEDKLKQYKLQYGGELPQQEQANFRRLQRLQDQIKSNNDSISRLQDRRLFLESQASALAKGAFAITDSGEPAVPSGILADLAARRRKVAELKQKYTEQHPAVVQAKWELEQAEAQAAIAREEAKKNPNKPPSPDLRSRTATPEESELGRIQAQISKIDLEVTALKRESANADALMNSIQSKIDRLPHREQEMVGLTRDYENLKKSYDDLLDKKLKANISMNLEENQKAERFQLIEPANLPSRPALPDHLMAFAIAMIASFIVGFGGSFALEILDPTLRGAKEFKSYFDIPVLITLPTIQNEEFRRNILLRSRAIKTAIVSIAGMYIVFLAVNGPKIKSILHSIIASIGGRN